MKITKQHIESAKDANACSVDYVAGQNVQRISQGELAWIEGNLTALAKQGARAIVKESKKGIKIFGVPNLSTLAYFGYGDGYGNGYGYGNGNGHGSGYGSGYGSGSGYGNGYGYGYGDGDGYGNGYGYSNGNGGSGYGDG